MVRSVEVIMETPRGQRLGVNYYVVLKDTDKPDRIAVYLMQGWTLFRIGPFFVNNRKQLVWPKSLSNYDHETQQFHGKGLTLIEANSVKHELGMGPMDRITVSESYFDTSTSFRFVDKTR